MACELASYLNQFFLILSVFILLSSGIAFGFIMWTHLYQSIDAIGNLRTLGVSTNQIKAIYFKQTHQLALWVEQKHGWGLTDVEVRCDIQALGDINLTKLKATEAICQLGEGSSDSWALTAVLGCELHQSRLLAKLGNW